MKINKNLKIFILLIIVIAIIPIIYFIVKYKKNQKKKPQKIKKSSINKKLENTIHLNITSNSECIKIFKNEIKEKLIKEINLNQNLLTLSTLIEKEIDNYSLLYCQDGFDKDTFKELEDSLIFLIKTFKLTNLNDLEDIYQDLYNTAFSLLEPKNLYENFLKKEITERLSTNLNILISRISHYLLELFLNRNEEGQIKIENFIYIEFLKAFKYCLYNKNMNEHLNDLSDVSILDFFTKIKNDKKIINLEEFESLDLNKLIVIIKNMIEFYLLIQDFKNPNIIDFNVDFTNVNIFSFVKFFEKTIEKLCIEFNQNIIRKFVYEIEVSKELVNTIKQEFSEIPKLIINDLIDLCFKNNILKRSKLFPEISLKISDIICKVKINKKDFLIKIENRIFDLTDKKTNIKNLKLFIQD